MPVLLALLLLLFSAWAKKPEFPLSGAAVGAVAVTADENGRASAWLTLVRSEGENAPWSWVAVFGVRDPKAHLPAIPAGVRVDLTVAEYRAHPYPVRLPGPTRVLVVRGRWKGKGRLPERLGEAVCADPNAPLPHLSPPLDRIALACTGENPPLGRSGEAVRFLLDDPFFGNGELWAWLQGDHALVTLIGSELALYAALPREKLPPESAARALGASPILTLPFPKVAGKRATFRLAYPNRLYPSAHEFRLEVVPEGRTGSLMRYRLIRYDLLSGVWAETEVFGAGALGPHYIHPNLLNAFIWTDLWWTWEGIAGRFDYGIRRAPLLEALYRADGRLERLEATGPSDRWPWIRLVRDTPPGTKR